MVTVAPAALAPVMVTIGGTAVAAGRRVLTWPTQPVSRVGTPPLPG